MEHFVWQGAADYCGVSLSYFRNLTKTGAGPTYLKPSPKKILFRKDDLDAWIASWVVKSNGMRDAN
jgi:hypothetical protein